MRPRILVTILALGLAAYVVVGLARRWARRAGLKPEAARAEQFACSGSFASDPGDPVQGFDEAEELEGTPLDVDAQSLADAQAAQDLVELESALESEPDVVIIEAEPGTVEPLVALEEQEAEIENRQRRGDDGDLYGGHTSPAVDRSHPDDDRAFDEGQNWLEALEASAAENGPEPERELADIVDDEDVLHPPHAAPSRDTPIADHGAGGRRGL
ncbi:MAG TPA: hypothetical protein VF469_01395 [Kofleriaceae bacterium]